MTLLYVSKEDYEKSLCFKCRHNETEEFRPNKPYVNCAKKGSVFPRTHRCNDFEEEVN